MTHWMGKSDPDNPTAAGFTESSVMHTIACYVLGVCGPWQPPGWFTMGRMMLCFAKQTFVELFVMICKGYIWGASFELPDWIPKYGGQIQGCHIGLFICIGVIVGVYTHPHFQYGRRRRRQVPSGQGWGSGGMVGLGAFIKCNLLGFQIAIYFFLMARVGPCGTDVGMAWGPITATLNICLQLWVLAGCWDAFDGEPYVAVERNPTDECWNDQSPHWGRGKGPLHTLPGPSSYVVYKNYAGNEVSVMVNTVPDEDCSACDFLNQANDGGDNSYGITPGISNTQQSSETGTPPGERDTPCKNTWILDDWDHDDDTAPTSQLGPQDDGMLGDTSQASGKPMECAAYQDAAASSQGTIPAMDEDSAKTDTLSDDCCTGRRRRTRRRRLRRRARRRYWDGPRRRRSWFR